MKKLFKLVKHSSVRAIMNAHNEGLVRRIKEIEGIDVDADEVQFGDDPALENGLVLESIHTAGFWAFADTWTNTIHVYFNERIDAKTRLTVLAHEFAHLVGKPRKDPLKEEQRCDAFAEQVVQVMVLWEQVLEPAA